MNLTADIDKAEPPARGPVGTHEYAFTFHGSGREYFRIWIVNLALTIATLGIYSAWAKVRRIQYFYRNTSLDGHAFNFHASPLAILLGRSIAVVLALAYHYAFGFSLTAGIAIVVTLVLAMPFLMMNALRFRLRFTSYRGLRFGFSGKPAGALLAYAPAVLIFTLPGLIAAMPETMEYGRFSFVAYLGWPLVYAGMKRYQHGNLRFASRASTFSTPIAGIVKAYIAVVVMIILSAVMIGLAWFVAAFFSGLIVGSHAGVVLSYFAAAAMACSVFVAIGPYTNVRIAELAWNHTQIADAFVDSHVDGAGLLKLQTINAVLTLSTLGLYRPFAVVSEYRFRLSYMMVRSSTPLERVLDTSDTRAPGAAGDAASDLLGFDLSW